MFYYIQLNDLAVQREGLKVLGVGIGPVHVDHGLSGTTQERPGLRQTLAACRAGDILVVNTGSIGGTLVGCAS